MLHGMFHIGLANTVGLSIGTVSILIGIIIGLSVLLGENWHWNYP